MAGSGGKVAFKKKNFDFSEMHVSDLRIRSIFQFYRYLGTTNAR